MAMDDGNWMQNIQKWGGSGWGAQPAQQSSPSLFGGIFGGQQAAQQPAAAPAASTSPFGGMFGAQQPGTQQPANNTNLGLGGDYFNSSIKPYATQTPTGDMSAANAGFNSLFGSGYNAAPATQAETYNTKQAATTTPVSAPAGSTGDPYQQLLNAKFASDYKTPDWYRASGLAADQSPERMREFFAKNPQYAQDWQNITSGGKSAFSTDGTSLIRSDFNSMSPEAAAYYRNNTNALLANEGFGHDPTLAYMNYFSGPGAIGANNKTMNISSYLQNNKWTPDGNVAAYNPAMYAKTPYGAGTASMGAPAGGAPGTPGATGGATGSSTGNPTGGVYPSPNGSGGAPTGGVYPTPYGSGGSGSYTSMSGQNPYSQQLADIIARTMTDNWQTRIAPQIASANLDRAINNDNLSWQMQGAQFGQSVQDRALARLLMGLGQGGNIQNTPLQYWQQILNQINGVGQGYGSSTQTGPGGSVVGGALGGAQLGGQLGNWWNSNYGNGGWGTGNSYGNQDLGAYL